MPYRKNRADYIVKPNKYKHKKPKSKNPWSRNYDDSPKEETSYFSQPQDYSQGYVNPYVQTQHVPLFDTPSVQDNQNNLQEFMDSNKPANPWRRQKAQPQYKSFSDKEKCCCEPETSEFNLGSDWELPHSKTGLSKQKGNFEEFINFKPWEKAAFQAKKKERDWQYNKHKENYPQKMQGDFEDKHYKITGSKSLFVMIEDLEDEPNYNYDIIKTNLGRWDFIIGRSMEAILQILNVAYANILGYITQFVFRSHGSQAEGMQIRGEIIHDFNDKNRIEVKVFDKIKELLTNEAYLLLTACGIAKSHKVRDVYGKYFIKDTSRYLLINHSNSEIRLIHKETKQVFLATNSWLLDSWNEEKNKPKVPWAGFVQLFYDKSSKKILWLPSFQDAKIHSKEYAFIEHKVLLDRNGQPTSADREDL